MNEENNNVVKINGVKTRKRTKEQIDELWRIFKEKYAEDYEKFMGYGIKEIEKIGYDKFINFWDVSSEEEMNFRKDTIRIIPCIHCRKEFATYQIDFGLCHKCSKDYDLEKFGSMCEASDKINPGSSYDLIASFVYLGLNEFFYKKTSFDKKVEQVVVLDDLSGELTKDFLLSFAGNKAKENKFLKKAKTLKMKQSTINRIISLERIFNSKDNKERKKERINKMYDYKTV